ncbi:uncharacterized protein N7479_010214 [Penicillium vulpinum]|uniref:uncharacterized protein n=1 Tax=Penicillium vulpinum TaxID=29845 RepID=UPI0025490A37|nr:uncharacterized protein N7479_010214 [Penicillium vulpinum]KAJ5951801.1 hypothetical protein N7479_010214 [Penicillium vulpinum]
MEFTWLPDIPQSRNRTRALRACPKCQRSKKRCRHLIPKWEPSDDPNRQSSPQPSNDPARPIHREVSNREQFPTSAHRNRARTTPDSPALLPVPVTERFVGDLNPESLIRERLDEPTGSPLRDRIGLWISSSAAQKAKLRKLQGVQRGQTTTEEYVANSPAQTAINGQAIASLLHQRFAAGMQACEQLPLRTRQSLSAIYFSKVNHIVPIVDRDFIQAQAEGLASVFLENAICLAAAKTHASNPYLRLVSGGPILPSRQFCSQIYKGLVVAMDTELEPDRLTRIRILALMSLHCEGLEGAEAASLHLCQAIHQAQTVGLHLGRPNQTSTDSLTKLFWCLWTLDKMHASIGGRPVLLADRDIGVVKPSVGTQTSRGAFEVWLAVSDLLATVISFYRPSAETTSGWEEGFPAFEDIVGEDTQDDLDFATLELYYHSVAILSCRYKPTENIDNTRLSSVRQGLAAVRIHSIVASECGNELPPLPIVPYSVTLSMGVSYRQLRSSRLITHLNRAKASLEACRSVLDNLSPYWYSAEAMARLGQKALYQIQGKPQSSRTNPTSLPYVAEPSQKQVNADSSVAEGLEIVDSAPQGNDAPRAKRQRNNGHGIAAMSPVPELATNIIQPPVGDPDTSIQDGFTDIDTLFGEFLDISLPTNFWDPIFIETQGQTNDPQS